ncbi:MAG: archease [Fimbriimonadales bacterium]
MGKYQILEHTADKGLEVEAETLSDLFITCAEGMFALMIDPASHPPTESLLIEKEAPDLEMLLVRWLNELVYLFEVKHYLFRDFPNVQVESDGERWRLRAEARYAPVTPHTIEWSGAPVKSVTYHGLELAQTDGGWHARYYVDV